MEDQCAWTLEESLWTGDPKGYASRIDPACLMVIPAEPHILAADTALDSMTRAPRWSRITFRDSRISRPAKGLIVLAYTAQARKPDGTRYVAHCSSTWRRKRHEDWRLVQHQQTPQA
jgi:hypothetical protein